MRAVMKVVLVFTLAPVIACGGSSDDTGSTAPTATTPAATMSAAPAHPLTGTWETKALTVDDMVTTLRENDLGKWVERFRKQSPLTDAPTRLVLEIGESSWDLYGEHGNEREEIDYDALLAVSGRTATVTHEGESNTYRWALDGDQLRLTWQSTTYGAAAGIPEEVYQRALYQTTPFRRAG